jgi:hypothetical protein
MDMRTNELGKFCTALLACGVLAFLTLAGCSGAVPVKPGSASYSLKILLEKNLDSKADYLYLEFLRNDSAFVGAFVIVDGDTIRTKSSGTADTTYLQARWQHHRSVSIKAVDTAKAYVYQTSVIIPDSLRISNVFPPARIWRPSTANARVEWAASAGTTNYIAAIQARLSGSPSRGQSVIAGSTLSQTFTPTAFYNPQTNQLVPDVYYIHVVAYTPTFVLRPGANYKAPAGTFPLTIDTKQISGAVAAAVVSARDTIVVSPSL